jgi:hypothetical protein
LRFHSDGPELPDDLLGARDEGKVLFFCGSGVSIAKARLPGFLGLAEQVLEALGALPDSAPRQLIEIAGALQERKVAGVGGIVAADRLFGLLEREFSPVDIDQAVGAVLKPAQHVDLGAHRVMLDLSRTANRTFQLVTTNFDLLFEEAAPRLPTWTPLNLPNLQHGPFDGIVHLHGMLDPSYQQSVGGNLVLSSAEFGQAYLSEGWATRFIQAATERYSIVFVGYTADDPPVQYLLEALNRDHHRPRQPMYAFQPGLQSEATALWAHKGVSAIPYEGSRDHAALWQTLGLWANRARNPDAWRKVVLRRAKSGPEELAPHERGQVMHLAMTPDGVKSMVTAKRQLLANWLLVFDPAERYETPGRRIFTAEQAAIDPFRDYCLDSDPVPKPDEEGQLFRQREVPKQVLDALIANRFDTVETETAALSGKGAVALLPLPPRLRALTAWIAQVADQPLALWWALNKPGLHPDLLNGIEVRFNRSREKLSDQAREVWRLIVESRKPTFRSPFDTLYSLQDRIKQEGWSSSARRALIKLVRPRLQVGRPLASGPVKDIQRVRLHQILRVWLEYDEEAPVIEVPDKELASITPMLRRLLEEVSTKEEEISSFTLNHIPPINFDPRLAGRAYERDHGFYRLVFWYIGLFQRLLAIDASQAHQEFEAWQAQYNTLFDRLRVWACGLPDFLVPEVATSILANLSDDAYWMERGQRDLLLSLKARWSQFDAQLRNTIEKRLLQGPPRSPFTSTKNHHLWRAHAILDRVTWLTQHGCAFVRPIDAILSKARAAAPQWKEEYAAHAADSYEGSGGFVSINAAFDHIKNVPIGELLTQCISNAGRDHGVFVDRDPLAGLAAQRPVRVLRALLLETLPDDQSRRWAWSKFLQSEARRKDPAKRTCLLARRLLNIADSTFALIAQSVSYWLESHAQQLYGVSAPSVEGLVDRIVAAHVPSDDTAGRRRRRQSDWLNAAQTSPAGHAVQTLLDDPALPPLQVGAGLPEHWKRRIESCIALPGDDGIFSLYEITRSLAWLFGRDPAWVETIILANLDSEGERQEAILAAFLNGPRVAERALYERMKQPIFKLINGELSRPTSDPRALAHFALSGWLTTDSDGRWLSDMEMRAALVRGQNELRQTVLWQVGQWDFPDKYYFLSKVWPLQVAARSATITDRLCAIAVEDEAHFSELADAIMPFLTPIRRGALMFTAGATKATDVLVAHPKLSLEIFWRILPENSADWPYGAHEGLEALHKGAKSIRSDPHMVELMRRRRKGYF